jgi:probable HAF family extracellular repeat protein
VFEGIGVIDGISIVSGVSGDGKTLTGRSNDSAIVWTSATGIQTLEKLTGYADCSATGISDDGNVQVGICGSASKTRPVRWVQKKVEPLDAQGKGWASAVNADGSVIVGYLYTSPLRPFRWTASSGLVEVPALSPTLDTYGFATNNDGSIVIGLSGTQGFRWSIGSNPESLGTRDCTPMGANADGSVIVGDLAAPNGKSHAFRWTQADGLVDLGVLSTDPETHAWDANADGTVIVGESGVIEGGEALLWTKSAGLQPLKSVLASAGADLTGWRVGTAFSVSANGKIIVGTGTHDGHSEGWIARLP